MTFGLQKGISHTATDDQCVDLVQQVLNDSNLVADLGSADNSNKRMVRVGKGQAQVLDLFFEQEAGGRRLQILGDAYRRCMGAVSCAEGVVNVDICVGSQCFGKFRVVFSLAGMEAHVLQQQNVAVIH